jgi:DNA-binding NtrC family response regulator
LGSILGRGAVIIVDADTEMSTSLRTLIQSTGYTVTIETTARAALRRIRSRAVNAIAVSSSIPDMHMSTFIEALRKLNLATGVVVYGRNVSAEEAISWMKTGVVDILLDPLDPVRTREALQRAFSYSAGHSRGSSPASRADSSDAPLFLYRSRAMKEVIHKAQRVAPLKATVLITGESGTGKDILSQEIHRLSGRKGVYTAINCSAIPETLLEDELFGHERGAFTGADSSREGKFEASDNGTILLDEIGEIPPATQVKLLRVLEDETITRLGGNTPVKVDVRLIAATNSDLGTRMDSRTFRKDLYYRLKVFEIHIPPLRARKTDIPLLAISFLREAADRNGLPLPELTREALDSLVSYSWPGNVRQLRNMMESVLIVSGERICREDLPPEIRGSGSSGNGRITLELPSTLAEVEEKVIDRTLELTGGNRTRASELLGIGRRTLQRKLSNEENS